MRGRAVSERGAVSAEYGVLLAFITIVIAAGVGLYGANLGAFILRLANQLGAVLS